MEKQTSLKIQTYATIVFAVILTGIMAYAFIQLFI